MSDEFKFGIVAVIGLTVMITSAIWATAYYNVTTTQAAIKAGMEEGVLPGRGSVSWVYPPDKLSR